MWPAGGVFVADIAIVDRASNASAAFGHSQAGQTIAVTAGTVALDWPFGGCICKHDLGIVCCWAHVLVKLELGLKRAAQCIHSHIWCILLHCVVLQCIRIGIVLDVHCFLLPGCTFAYPPRPWLSVGAAPLRRHRYISTRFYCSYVFLSLCV